MKKKTSCLVLIIMATFNTIIGAWSVIEILSWFGKSIPFWGNAIIGLFTAEFSIPIAIIGYILRLFNIF